MTSASSLADPAALSSCETDRRINSRLDRALCTLDGQTVASLFVLPKDLRSVLSRLGPILEDDRPEVIAALQEDEIAPSYAAVTVPRGQARAS